MVHHHHRKNYKVKRHAIGTDWKTRFGHDPQRSNRMNNITLYTTPGGPTSGVLPKKHGNNGLSISVHGKTSKWKDDRTSASGVFPFNQKLNNTVESALIINENDDASENDMINESLCSISYPNNRDNDADVDGDNININIGTEKVAWMYIWLALYDICIYT